MIIQCPYCHTRFRLPESRLVGANPMLKCSRCRHIFPAERTQRAVGEEDAAAEEPARAPAAPPPPAPPPPPTAAGQPELDLPFDDPPSWEGEQPELPSFREDEDYSLGTSGADGGRAPRGRDTRREPRLLSEVDGTSARGARAAAGPAPAEDATSYSFDDDELEETAREDEDDEELEDEVEDDEQAEDQEDEEEPAGPGRGASGRSDDDMKRTRRWLVPLALFFSIVVSVYFFLAQELIRDREFAEQFIARLPMVGSSLAADRLLFRKVALNEVEGSFIRVKQGKEVFVISGTALNTASRPLRNIRIEGTLVDGAGRPLQQEAITCGGMDARRLLQGLSLREVEMLGQVVPSNKFRLEPGDTTTFAIVFTNPPPGAAEFSARVASAQR